MPLTLDHINADIQAQLNPPAGERHKSPLFKAKEEFLVTVEEALKVNPEYANDPDALKARMDQARTDLDSQIVESAAKGAQMGADGKKFKSPQEVGQGPSGLSGMVANMADSAISSIGGFFGMIWSFLKQMPGVGDMLANLGDWVSDKISNKAPEEKTRENMVNGAVAGLSQPIEIEGQVFTLSQEDAVKIHDKMSQIQTTPAPEEATTPVASLDPAKLPLSRGSETVLLNKEFASLDNGTLPGSQAGLKDLSGAGIGVARNS